MGKEVNISRENLVEFCKFLNDNKAEKRNLAKWLAEKQGIKEASARRNINRIINYYLQTGKQARSGKKYIPLIKEYLSERFTNSISAGDFVGVFPDYDLAKEYVADLTNVLSVGFTGDFEPYVFRIY